MLVENFKLPPFRILRINNILNLKLSRNAASVNRVQPASGRSQRTVVGAPGGSCDISFRSRPSAADRVSFGEVPGEVWMTVAGVRCGLAFVHTPPYLGGAGGTPGTIAFGSTIAIRGLLELSRIVRARFPSRAGIATR